MTTGLQFNAQLSGWGQFDDRLKLLGTDVATKTGQAANRAGAVATLKLIKQAAPVSKVPEGKQITRHNKGGTTRTEIHHKIVNSLKVVKTRSSDSTTVSNAVTVGKAYQATFVEFGSIRNAPNAFMRRAIESNQDAIIQKIAEVLDQRLAKAGV